MRKMRLTNFKVISSKFKTVLREGLVKVVL